MDTIAIGWKATVSTFTIESAIIGAGLEIADMSNDTEVQPGIQECKNILGIDEIRYLTQSTSDTTSNNVTLRIYEEITNNDDICIVKIGKFIENLIENSEIWFLFAHDWPAGIYISYLEGSSNDLECYMKLNRGAFRSLYSLEKQKRNLDLDTPLIWKLKGKY